MCFFSLLWLDYSTKITLFGLTWAIHLSTSSSYDTMLHAKPSLLVIDADIDRRSKSSIPMESITWAAPTYFLRIKNSLLEFGSTTFLRGERSNGEHHWCLPSLCSPLSINIKRSSKGESFLCLALWEYSMTSIFDVFFLYRGTSHSL